MFLPLAHGDLLLVLSRLRLILVKLRMGLHRFLIENIRSEHVLDARLNFGSLVKNAVHIDQSHATLRSNDVHGLFVLDVSKEPAMLFVRKELRFASLKFLVQIDQQREEGMLLERVLGLRVVRHRSTVAAVHVLGIFLVLEVLVESQSIHAACNGPLATTHTLGQVRIVRHPFHRLW